MASVPKVGIHEGVASTYAWQNMRSAGRDYTGLMNTDLLESINVATG